MPLRRKTHDGSSSGRNPRSDERGDTFSGEVEIDQLIAPTRAKRNVRSVNDSDSDHEEEGGSDRYLITYADLITLLLGLFIILYAISNVDATKYEKMMTAMGSVFGSEKFRIDTQISSSLPSAADMVINPMDLLRQDLNEIININELNNSVTIENNQRGVTIRILDDILFPSGEAELRTNAQEVLKLVAGIIKELPNDIRVEGHTDNISINSAKYPSNWHLSIARALNTAYYLIQTENINPDKVSVVGYSEYNPIENNATPEGRAKNRRVDIIVINNVE